MSRAALLGFVVYVVGGLFLGELYPWSRYDMFATTANRPVGAVPRFLVDDTSIMPEDYTGFIGIDTSRLLPVGVPCSMEPRVHEVAVWMARHPEKGTGAPLELVVAYDFYPSGRRVLLARGQVWKR